MIEWQIPTTIQTAYSRTYSFLTVYQEPDYQAGFSAGDNRTTFENFSRSQTIIEETFVYYTGPEGEEVDTENPLQGYATNSSFIFTGIVDNEDGASTTQANTGYVTTSTTLDVPIISTTTTETEVNTFIWSTSGEELNPAFYKSYLNVQSTVTELFNAFSREDVTTQLDDQTQQLGNTYATIVQCKTSNAFAEIIWNAENFTCEDIFYEPLTNYATSGTRVTLYPWTETEQVPIATRVLVDIGAGGGAATPITEAGKKLTLEMIVPTTSETTVTVFENDFYPLRTKTESTFIDGFGNIATHSGSTTKNEEVEWTAYLDNVYQTANISAHFEIVIDSDGNEVESHVSDAINQMTKTTKITSYYDDIYLVTNGNGTFTYNQIAFSIGSVERIVNAPSYNFEQFPQSSTGARFEPNFFAETFIHNRGTRLIDINGETNAIRAFTYGVAGAQVNGGIGGFFQIDVGAEFRVTQESALTTALVDRNLTNPLQAIITPFPATFTARSTDNFKIVSISANPPSITAEWADGDSVARAISFFEISGEEFSIQKNSRASVVGGNLNFRETAFESFANGAYLDQDNISFSQVATVESREWPSNIGTTWYQPVIGVRPMVEYFTRTQTFISYTELRNNYNLPPNSHLP